MPSRKLVHRRSRATRSPPADAAWLEEMLRPLRRNRLLMPPREGWAKAIRTARGVSTRQMAGRLGVSQPAVVQAERNEAAGTISLALLFRLAQALDCEFHYVMVPKSPLKSPRR